MIKLLIVDDEHIEREGLKAMIHRSLPLIEIEQARNGKHAIELVHELHPDLILMDIKMPGMSGLEAIELIQQDYPHIKFVMVTAYDTFDYARTAIKLGVKDYLLKPSKAKEIVQTVQRVIDQIEQERQQIQLKEEQDMVLQKVIPVVETDLVTQLLFDHVHDVHIEELMSLLKIEAKDEAFIMTVFLPLGYEHLYSHIRQKTMEQNRCWVGALIGRYIPIVVFRDQTRSYRTQAIHIARNVLHIVEQQQNQIGERAQQTTHHCYIGIGGLCKSIHHIRQSYQESMIASLQSVAASKFQFYEDSSFVQLYKDRSTTSSFQWEHQFIERIRQGQWEKIEADFEEYLKWCVQYRIELHVTQQRLLEMLWVVSRVLIEMGVEVETPIFSKQWSRHDELLQETKLILHRLQLVSKAYQERIKPDVIQRVKQYINEHAHQDISLETISNYIELSPVYVSKLFKEQLGVNYIDFLTQCRIDKAKKLMSNPELSLKEITYSVGYHDPNYFSKVFKKMSGISPTEYRKTLLG